MKKVKTPRKNKPPASTPLFQEADDRFEEVKGDLQSRSPSLASSRSESRASSYSMTNFSTSQAKSPRHHKRSITDQRYLPNVGMDAYERRVLQRKRPLVAEKLGFSPEDQKTYRRLGMLNDDAIGEIMVEVDDFHQSMRFLEILPDQAPSMFHILMETLAEKGHGWVAEEMKIELLAEKGKLEIEEYVYREAGAIVHRQFSGNRRLSQNDLKEVQMLLGLRYQLAKDSWYEQMMRVHEDLKQALNQKWLLNNKLKGLSQNIAAFIKLQKNNINQYAHDMMDDMTYFRDDLDPDSIKQDYVTLVQKMTSSLFEIISKLVLEKDSFVDERDRCIGVLKLKKPVIQLDTAIDDALVRAAEDAIRMRSQVNISDSMVEDLENRLKTLKLDTDRELADQQEKLMYWESLALQREERIMRLDRQLSEMEQKRAEADDEALKWKKRCMILEKTRRLGYYHPGWHDRMYHMKSYDYGRVATDEATPPPLVALVPKVDKNKQKRPPSPSNRRPVTPISVKKNGTRDKEKAIYKSGSNIS